MSQVGIILHMYADLLPNDITLKNFCPLNFYSSVLPIMSILKDIQRLVIRTNQLQNVVDNSDI